MLKTPGFKTQLHFDLDRIVHGKSPIVREVKDLKHRVHIGINQQCEEVLNNIISEAINQLNIQRQQQQQRQPQQQQPLQQPPQQQYQQVRFRR